MLEFPLMLWVKWLVVDRIHPQSNKFATGAENKITCDLKRNDSPEQLKTNSSSNPKREVELKIGCMH